MGFSDLARWLWQTQMAVAASCFFLIHIHSCFTLIYHSTALHIVTYRLHAHTLELTEGKSIYSGSFILQHTIHNAAVPVTLMPYSPFYPSQLKALSVNFIQLNGFLVKSTRQLKKCQFDLSAANKNGIL